eukprot:1160625-Pelagomonas_calceolata.AAC.8
MDDWRMMTHGLAQRMDEWRMMMHRLAQSKQHRGSNESEPGQSAVVVKYENTCALTHTHTHIQTLTRTHKCVFACTYLSIVAKGPALLWKEQ